MFRSDKYKFYFTHIPKTGGTSIKKALLPYANKGQLYFNGEKVTDGEGFHPHVPLTASTAKSFNDYYKFAFVRNPWARFVSLYLFLRGRDRDIVRNKSFSFFITDIVTNRNMYSRTQVRFGLEHMDYVGQFENIDADFQLICRNIGIPDEIVLSHFKDQGEYNYRDFYTGTTKAMVKAHCQKTIKWFNYKF